MFSSNQKLEVSGELNVESILCALRFALKLSGFLDNLTTDARYSDCRFCYQITKHGTFCLGWGYKEAPQDWKMFNPTPELKDLANQICTKVGNSEYLVPRVSYSGTYKFGFLMRDMSSLYEAERRGIKNPSYGIVEFEPYMCFYAK